MTEPTEADRTDIGTEFVRQADHPNEAGLTAFEADLASKTGPKGGPKDATDQAAPADWIDGHPQLEAIAAAVWEQCGRSDSGTCVEDDPRNIAVAALAAVLPAPTAQATEAEPAERRERYAVAIHDAMESDLSLIDQEPGVQALFARAAEAVVAVADAEAPAATCSAQHREFDDGRLCIRAAEHHGDHIDERGYHWSDTVAVYPLADGTFRTGINVRAALRRMAAESAPAAAPQPVRHAPGKAILCPDCRDKGHSACVGAEQPAAAQQPKEARP
jgi:hypothetical protein